MDSTTTTTSLYIPQSLSDTGSRNGEFTWPNHVKEFVLEHKKPGELMSVDEFTALLVHVALVEMGYIPAYAPIDPSEHVAEFVTRKSIMMSVKNLLIRIPESCRVKTALLLNYYGIRAIDCEESYEADEEKESDDEIGESKESPIVPEDYSFTGPILVTYCFEDKGLVSFGIHGRASDGANLEFDIRNFVEPVQNFEMYTKLLLSGKQWLNILRLIGWKFVEHIRANLAYPLMDYAGGIIFRARFQDLPNETLELLGSYLQKKDILNLRLTSSYYKSVAEHNFQKYYNKTIGSIIEEVKTARTKRREARRLQRTRNFISLWHLFR